jgi:cytidine deaminase
MTDIENQMQEKAKAVLENAYAPYSNFSVGACVRTENDELYSGCNVENASYELTQCAESVAIGEMIKNGQRKIKEVVVMVLADQLCPPCGACRQRLAEFSTPTTLVHLHNTNGDHRSMTMADLFPFPFDSKNLVNNK